MLINVSLYISEQDRNIKSNGLRPLSILRLVGNLMKLYINVKLRYTLSDINSFFSQFGFSTRKFIGSHIYNMECREIVGPSFVESAKCGVTQSSYLDLYLKPMTCEYVVLFVGVRIILVKVPVGTNKFI